MPLSLAAQTAYAELIDQAGIVGLDSLTGIKGSFHCRKLKGRDYVYFGYSDPISKAQHRVYIGPASERVDALVARFNSGKAPKKLAPNAKAAVALGCTAVFPKHYRIIAQLSAYGFFRAGGVLVGTHAFSAMANVLGVQWRNRLQTQDVDFAHAGRNVALALPTNVRLSVHDALTSLEMGLLPLQELDGGASGQYANQRDPELRVDFLTPVVRKQAAVTVNELGLTLEPVKFIEYLLEGTTQAAAFSHEGATIVNIPAPERFAIHKLIVAAERTGQHRAKSRKDLVQAACLIEWHQENGHIGAVRAAWRDAVLRGPGWKKRLQAGQKALVAHYPAAQEWGPLNGTG